MKEPKFFKEKSESSQESSELEKLPEELLLKVLDYTTVKDLSKVAIVNKNFNRLANDPHLALGKTRQQLQLKAAVVYGELNKVEEILVQDLVNINYIYQNGSLLHSVARLGPEKTFTYSIAERLISYGADVNIKDKEGDTPLHIAVQFKYPKMAKLLIEKGSNLDLQNNKEYKPVDIASHQLFKDAINTNSNWEAVITFLQEFQRRQLEEEKASMLSVGYSYPGGPNY